MVICFPKTFFSQNSIIDSSTNGFSSFTSNSLDPSSISRISLKLNASSHIILLMLLHTNAESNGVNKVRCWCNDFSNK
ncbi:hypothetical protein EUGRSUZ_E00902 [Eucalyptus grandis]|uniref:Uncharacterized protein n=2 Tax=Eucalyptus grandis TaxID=71139 RepID=A0ACC3KSR8_EUCGR|nr:hypothetical protein EUGRSUZ_E00902 [Eucalyptus grandis]